MAKKDTERCCLGRFRQVSSEFPQGAVVDSERPDVLVRSPERTVGIEVVDYVRGQGQPDGSSDLRREEIGNRIADQAGKTWEKQGGAPLHVWFSLGLYALPDKASVPAVARSLVDVASHHMPPSGSAPVHLRGEQLKGTALESVVGHVSILAPARATGSSWAYSPGAGFIEVTPGELQELIDSKDANVDTYLEKCDSIWLLIAARWGPSLPRTGRLATDVPDQVFRARFDSVFFLNLEEGNVARLKTRRPDVN